MPETGLLRPELFSDDAISPETARVNREILDKLEGAPDMWSFPPAVVRARRRQGLGPFPLAPQSPRAVTLEIEGPHGPVPLRVIAPQSPAGVYLHIHGGGWMLGAADEQDPRLERIADNCNLAVVSVDYRLAPEHPWPQGADDCEAAALWLLGAAPARFGTDRLLIGGESAGAHLSVVTMLRLRDRHGLTPFRAANLVAGCYDLRFTPSVRNWGEQKLVLNTRDIAGFVEGLLRDGGSAEDPDVSPILADLSGLPPALFTIGTRDLLLDDSLFMAARWSAAANDAELALYPGGAHVFMFFPCTIGRESLERMESFLAGAIAR